MYFVHLCESVGKKNCYGFNMLKLETVPMKTKKKGTDSSHAPAEGRVELQKLNQAAP